MVIVGAQGFAKEILETFHQKDDLYGLAFYDDINAKDLLYGKFKVLKDESEVKEHFENFGPGFTLGVGKPVLRKKLYEKFINWGGEFTATISPTAIIGSYEVVIGKGTNVLSNAIFSNSTTIGMGGIVYYNVVITHDCTIGDFVELSPGVQILGRCKIGNFTQIGAGSVILPGIEVGDNVVIGAGAIVTKNVPSNCLAVGVPAKIIKQTEPLNF